MNPDVAQAVPELVRAGILKDDQASLLLRMARGELLSVNAEIRLMFYLGVLLTAAGAGVLVKANYGAIGPLAIAIAVGCGAALSFGWALRKAPAFSWSEIPSPSLSFDYLLLLGVLLAAADLGFVEMQFTPLGANWPWHLLVTSLLMAWIAVRYDSRTVFSLALSTFAAWRGVSVSLIEKPVWSMSGDPVRWNALCCGILFLFLGHFMLRNRKKAHFEPIAVYLGWLLVLGPLVSGGTDSGLKGAVYLFCLTAAGSALAWHYHRSQRFALFAAGVLALFIAFTLMIIKMRMDFVLSSLMICAAAVGLVVVLWNSRTKQESI